MILAARLWLQERRLLRENALWRAHTDHCQQCTVAATGNRAQRRSIKGRFCAKAGCWSFILRPEWRLSRRSIRTAWTGAPGKKCLTTYDNPGQGGLRGSRVTFV